MTKTTLLFLLIACLFWTTGTMGAEFSPQLEIEGLHTLRYTPDDHGALSFRIDRATRLSSQDLVGLLADQLDISDEAHWIEIGRQGEMVRFQQLHQGVPVVGAQLVLWESEGSVHAAVGRVSDVWGIDPVPSIAAEEAVAFALDGLHDELVEPVEVADLITPPEPELFVLSTDSTYDPESMALVYRVFLDLPEIFGGMEAMVRADSGELVQLIRAARPAFGDGHTYYSGYKQFEVDFNSANPFPYSLTTPQLDMDTREMAYATGNPQWNSNEVTSLVHTFGAPEHGVPLEIHWATQEFLDYLKTIHLYDLTLHLPGTLTSYANCGNEPDNASASPSNSSICYGNRTATGNSFATVDVIGHEIAHLMTAATSNLIYAGESGALNESFSDILGRLLEDAVSSTSNWTIAEQSGNFVRSMGTPKVVGHPDTYQGQNWYVGNDTMVEVHTNSGVQNFWFYLLAQGEQSGLVTIDGIPTHPVVNVQGIGLLKAGRIAVQNQMNLPNSATFSQSAAGSLLQASLLYGSYTPEHRSTHDAWYGAGVEPQPFSGDVIYPENGVVDVPAGVVTLRWLVGNDVGVWDVEISTTPDMQTIVASGQTAQTETTNGVTQALYEFGDAQKDVTYYWRVRSGFPNAFGETKSWRDLHTFTADLEAPTPIGPMGPADTRTGLWYPWGLDFSWEHEEDAQYEVQIWETSGAGCPEPSTLLIDQPGMPAVGNPAPGDPVTHTFHLPVSSTLCWRVRAQTVDGSNNVIYSEWSPSSHFSTDLPAVTAQAPVAGAVVDPWTLTFNYDAPPFAQEVRVEIGLKNPINTDGLDKYCTDPAKFEPDIDPYGTWSVRNVCFAANEHNPSGSLTVPIPPRWEPEAPQKGFYSPTNPHTPWLHEYRLYVWGPEVGWAATVDGSALGEQGATSKKETFRTDGFSKFAPVVGIFKDPARNRLDNLGTYAGIHTAAPVFDLDLYQDKPESETVTVAWQEVPGAEGYVVKVITFWDEKALSSDARSLDTKGGCAKWVKVASLGNPNQPSAEIARKCLGYGGNTLGSVIQIYPYVVSPHMSTPAMEVEVGLRLWKTLDTQDTRFKVFMADVVPPTVLDVNAADSTATKTVLSSGTRRFRFDAHFGENGADPNVPASLKIKPWMFVDVGHQAGDVPNRFTKFLLHSGPGCGGSANTVGGGESVPFLGTKTLGMAFPSVQDGDVYSLEIFPRSYLMDAVAKDLSIPPHSAYASGQSTCLDIEFQIKWSDPEPEPEPEPAPTPNSVLCQQVVNAGGNMPETHVVELGSNSGTTIFGINTFTVPDRMLVKYEGQTIFDTLCLSTEPTFGCDSQCCCSGGACDCAIPFSGTSTQMTVEVIPNCAGTADTAWAFTLSCP
ncbi:MAG: M4 family metallopeptidase [Acidobacteriota bacterium]